MHAANKKNFLHAANKKNFLHAANKKNFLHAGNKKKFLHAANKKKILHAANKITSPARAGKREGLKPSQVFAEFAANMASFLRKEIQVAVREELSRVIREIKIEVFRHFPRTANVKKSRDHCVGVRFAV